MTTQKDAAASQPSSGGVLSWPLSEEQFIAAKDGARIFLRVAKPAAESRAVVVLTHGLGEHSGRYAHVAQAFVEHGFAVVGWDLRGHGRSSGQRGDIRRYAMFTEDLRKVCAEARQAGLPLFLYGHSLGGQIVLRSLAAHEVDCSGAVVASPWLRLAFTPPWWKLLLAQAALRIWPGYRQQTGMNPERLSRDLAHLKMLPEIELVHHRISARMYFAVRRVGEETLQDAAHVHTPLLLLHGDADPVTSHAATSEFFTNAGSKDKSFRIFAEMRHETHNDLDRALVITAITDWITARVAKFSERPQ